MIQIVIVNSTNRKMCYITFELQDMYLIFWKQQIKFWWLHALNIEFQNHCQIYCKQVHSINIILWKNSTFCNLQFLFSRENMFILPLSKIPIDYIFRYFPLFIYNLSSIYLHKQQLWIPKTHNYKLSISKDNPT